MFHQQISRVKFAIVVALFSLSSSLFATDAVANVQYHSRNSGANNWQTGNYVVLHLTVPSGTANGQYRLSWASGSTPYITVTGGVASPAEVTATWGTAGASYQPATGSSSTTVIYLERSGVSSTPIGNAIFNRAADDNSSGGSGPTGNLQYAVDAYFNGASPASAKKVHLLWTATSNDGKPHLLKFWYNGVNVFTGVLPGGVAGGAYVTATFDYTQNNANNGDTYAFSGDSGAQGAGGTVVFPPEVTTLEIIGPTANWDYTSRPPNATPAPTGSQTNTGTTTSTSSGGAAGGSNPASVVNNNNTTINGGTTGATNQDIYNDVLQALLDAGKNGVGYSNPTLMALHSWSSNIYDPPGATEGVPTGDDLKTMGEGLQNSWNSIKDRIGSEQTAIDEINNAAGRLIPDFGSVPNQTLVLSFPAPQALFGVDHFTMDANPYADVIANFRLVCSVAFGVLLFFAFCRYTRGALADL